MSCTQCHGCAYKQGAAANLEVDNKLRGIICALGAIPFFCHDSLGYGEDGYDHKAKDQLWVLCNPHTMAEIGASELLQKTREELADLRICQGWRASVARLKILGWFDDPAKTLARRIRANMGYREMESFLKETGAEKEELHAAFKETVQWFVAEAKEAGVNIKFVFGEDSNGV